jgi:hypothetical protein
MSSHSGALANRSKHARKRTDLEIARDRALVTELHYQGYKDFAIVELLNNRPDVDYQLSAQTIYNDRKVIMDSLLEEGKENSAKWLQEEIFRLNMVEREAWLSYKKSMEPFEEEKVIKALQPVYDLIDGKKVDIDTEVVVSRVEKLMRQGAGDPKWLQIILDCVEKRGKLRGLYKFQARIETDSEIRIKTYHNWTPEGWGAPNNIIDVTPEVKKIENGQSDS